MGITVKRAIPGGKLKLSPPLGFKEDPSYPLEAESGPWHQVNFPTDPEYANVVLHLPFQSDLLDTKGHTMTSVGSPTITSSESPYSGGSSVELNSSTFDGLFTPDSNDFEFGTGDFTIEGWF